jgi:hypothetical protein
MFESQKQGYAPSDIGFGYAVLVFFACVFPKMFK